MKLYLSSYKLGNKQEELIKWRKENNNNIALITSARDMYPDSERKQTSIMSDYKLLEELGFNVTLISLRDYFDDKEKLSKLLEKFNAFFVIGGNVFVLRQAMKLSGFDTYLKEISQKENFLYAGYSAGICVLAPSIKEIKIVDDNTINPYNTELINEGLALINYIPVPHFESDHAESPAIGELVKYLKNNNISYKTLRDGDVIIETVEKIESYNK